MILSTCAQATYKDAFRDIFTGLHDAKPRADEMMHHSFYYFPSPMIKTQMPASPRAISGITTRSIAGSAMAFARFCARRDNTERAAPRPSGAPAACVSQRCHILGAATASPCRRHGARLFITLRAMLATYRHAAESASISRRIRARRRRRRVAPNGRDDATAAAVCQPHTTTVSR